MVGRVRGVGPSWGHRPVVPCRGSRGRCDRCALSRTRRSGGIGRRLRTSGDAWSGSGSCLTGWRGRRMVGRRSVAPSGAGAVVSRSSPGRGAWCSARVPVVPVPRGAAPVSQHGGGCGYDVPRGTGDARARRAPAPPGQGEDTRTPPPRRRRGAGTARHYRHDPFGRELPSTSSRRCASSVGCLLGKRRGSARVRQAVRSGSLPRAEGDRPLPAGSPSCAAPVSTHRPGAACSSPSLEEPTASVRARARGGDGGARVRGARPWWGRGRVR